MEEFFFEEETFTFNEEPQFEMEMPMEMETFTFAEEFIEEFFMEMDEEFFTEEGMSFEDGPMIVFADDKMMEEIYEETEELVATFLPMVSEEEEFSYEESFIESDGPIFMEPTEDGEGFSTETFQEEEMMEEKPMMTETFQEEEIIEEEMPEEAPTEMVEEEVMEEETTEMAEEAVEEEPTKMVEATNEEEKEEIKEEKSNSETPKKSAVQTKKLAKQKAIQQKKAIVKNLARIMDKVDKDIKDISKNLAVKNIIKMEAMTSEQVSLNAYANTQFYKPKNIYLEQLPIFDSRLIYADKSLATYIQNDKIEIKARKLQEINSRKQKLLIELEMLKNG
jgi:outer membrane biosynthesis protein TonB